MHQTLTGHENSAVHGSANKFETAIKS